MIKRPVRKARRARGVTLVVVVVVMAIAAMLISVMVANNAGMMREHQLSRARCLARQSALSAQAWAELHHKSVMRMEPGAVKVLDASALTHPRVAIEAEVRVPPESDLPDAEARGRVQRGRVDVERVLPIAWP